jgi:hypothetical protein
LSSILLPRSLRNLSAESLCNCVELISVLFESESCLANIEADAFAACSTFREIVLPSSVSSIDGSAFRGSPMRRIDFEDGNCHFRSCGDFITDASGREIVLSFNRWEDVRIMRGIRRIGTRCFGKSLSDLDLSGIPVCSAFFQLPLKSVTIPSSVEIVGVESFCGCVDLCSVRFESGSTLELIGPRAFCYCISLSSIVIPCSVLIVSEQSFCYCMALGSVIFENQAQLREIRSEAFSFCINLTTLSIPASVSFDWSDSFSGCRALQVAGVSGVDLRGITSPFRVLQSL